MHILDSLFLVPGQRLDILWLNKESLGLRNKNLIWICHSTVVKDLHSFPLREGSVAQLFLPTWQVGHSPMLPKQAVLPSHARKWMWWGLWQPGKKSQLSPLLPGKYYVILSVDAWGEHRPDILSGEIFLLWVSQSTT